MTPLYRTEQIRAIEAYCIGRLPPGTLMTRAAKSLATLASSMMSARSPAKRVVVLSGPGNNGEDARIAGEILSAEGATVTRLVLDDLIRMAGQKLTMDEFPGLLGSDTLLIDGLFGIGLSRDLSAPLLECIALINRCPCQVLAVDIPSGLDASTGNIRGDAISADVTLTFLMDKVGLHTGEAASVTGEVRLDRLGCERFLDDQAKQSQVQAHQITPAWVYRTIRPRSRLAHKGSSGSVLVLGGGPGMRGAAVLAALGAQSSGAGKVYVQFLGLGAEETFALAVSHPSLLVFDPEPAERREALKKMDAIVIGCGLGQSVRATACLREVMQVCGDSDIPLVLDADALNLLGKDPALRALLPRSNEPDFGLPPIPPGSFPGQEWVMTPHPLEASRLLGVPTSQIQSDRPASTILLTQTFGMTAVLKGPGSIIGSKLQADPAIPAGRAKDLDEAPEGALPASVSEAFVSEVHLSIAPFGSPALAVGGTGDILAGMIGSLLAQGFSAHVAATLGASIHALAGEAWARSYPKCLGMKAEDLPACIVNIMNALSEP